MLSASRKWVIFEDVRRRTSENTFSTTLVHKPRICFAFIAVYRGSLYFVQRNSEELGYPRLYPPPAYKSVRELNGEPVAS